MKLHEKVLSAFKNIDIELAKRLIHPDISCGNVSHSLFMERLAFIFNQQRLSGKPLIEITPLSFYTNTHSFIVQQVYFCIETLFTFHYKEDKLVKIDFKAISEYPEEEHLTPCQFFFYPEEQLDFQADLEYLEKYKQCKHYLREIENSITGLKYEQLLDWINKVKRFAFELNSTIQYKAFQPFLNTYSVVDSLIYLYSDRESVENAFLDFETFKRSPDEWKIKHDYLITHCLDWFMQCVTLYDDKVFVANCNVNLRLNKYDWYLYYRVFNRFIEQHNILIY